MKKFFFVSIILILFLSFAIFFCLKNTSYKILEIFEPSIVAVDFNNNGQVDENETICIPNIETFSYDLNSEPPKFVKDLNLSKNDAISMIYMTEDYVSSLLKDTYVNVKFTNATTPDCRYANLFINGVDYSEALLYSGFGAKNGIYDKDNFLKNLAKAKKLNLVILNKKSNKYHKLDCKYGLISSDYILIPKKQLSPDASPCQFCHIRGKEYKNKSTNIVKKQATKLKLPALHAKDGEIKLLLTDLTSKLKPDRDCKNEVCKDLVDIINKTEHSIDIAIYGWDEIPAVQSALNSAKARGVIIRVVYDASSTPEKEYYKDMPKLINLADVSRSDYNSKSVSLTDKLMHNKFIIFDNKIVFTGSMNFSITGLSGFNSNAVAIINSSDVAKLYTAEFEQMLTGHFHNDKKTLNMPNKFQIKDTFLSVYFSPYDNVASHITPIINNSDKYIYIPAFLVTNNEIINSLISAKKRGIDVKIIMDASGGSSNSAKLKLLRSSGIAVKTENYAGKIHSKSMIIDDKYVIIGSMNFSGNGNLYNDENVLIMESKQFAKIYKDYFLYLWTIIPDKWLKYSVRAESWDSIGSCSDGIDNDFDGQVDKDDDGCKAR